MPFATADLCDVHGDAVRVCDPVFRAFGGAPSFHGPIATVSSFEDNALVRQRLEEPGEGRVLVVDGGGSMRRAMIGGLLGQLAVDNGWAGIEVNGCVRDSEELAGIAIGIRALGTCPRKSAKTAHGHVDVPVAFANTIFHPGDYVYVDGDGMILSPSPLL